jgi:hypothetical protein
VSRSYSKPDAGYWMPVRFVSKQQVCDFCWGFIPPQKPGTSTGSRGTKAYYCPGLGIWECIPCRQLVTPELEDARRAPIPRLVEACVRCDYRRPSTDILGLSPFFPLAICTGCELGEGRGFHRTCPRCGHLEHRSHADRHRQLQGVA